ncbi:cysteine--tRNA ligase [Chloroflexota bacterium]
MKIYNTLSGKKEEFAPQSDEVKMYVCGVTPYSDAHIGHAMSYVIFDVIKRHLQFSGYKVKYVQNITDIDDKIIERANNLGISTNELAEKFTNSYFEDMEALNVMRADIQPRATEVIPDMIKVIQGLVDKGFAYPSQGSVYFRVKNVPDYGNLSHRNLESMMSAEGALGSDEKESPMDFVLWKAVKPDEPSWESPWGDGRPGWHIECSTMSMKYFGDTFDIHGGGQDLVFPHHENEIAQSESFTGIKPVVNHWIHNGLVQIGKEKMSKSIGNLITIKEALSRYSADAIRIFILSSYYRSPLTYSEEAFDAAEKGADRLRQVIKNEEKAETEANIDIDSYKQKFTEAMDDDFGTPQALAIIFDLAREINRLRDSGQGVVKAEMALMELANVLGLTLRPYTPTSSSEINTELIQQLVNSTIEQVKKIEQPQLIEEITSEVSSNKDNSTKNLVDSLIFIRNKLRQYKQWQITDDIRNRLNEMGIILEDTPQGTIWKQKR